MTGPGGPGHRPGPVPAADPPGFRQRSCRRSGRNGPGHPGRRGSRQWGGRHGSDRWFETGGYSGARVLTGKWILSGAYRQEISHEPFLLPPLNALRAFEATARLGGVGRAARPACHPRCGQPAAEAAGRPSRPGAVPACRSRPAPDRCGHAAAGSVQQAFGGIEDCVRELRRPAAASALVLGCSGSVLARWMIPRLPALQAALPGVRLQWSALDGSFTEAQAALDSVLLLAQGPWPRAGRCVSWPRNGSAW